ncbi:MAG TPA: alpha/beta hydrolase [Allosphingosinicella sp.]
MRGDEALDPELRPIIVSLREQMAARGSLETVTPEQMRVRAAAQFEPWNRDPDPVAEVRDFMAAGVPVRLYDPQPGVETGLLVYLHGGGWVVGDLDLEDAPLRRLARSGVRILSVDYRLAPEHPYPAALDDVLSVWRWLTGGQTDLPLDGPGIGLGGASSGANLALGTSLRLRDGAGPGPAFLLLMYGAYAGGEETPSYLAFADGRFGLPRAAMDWFWRAYAGRDLVDADCYAAPLRCDLAGLPPTFLNYAELDVLRDDSVRLAERLRAAGVRVEERGYRGAIHGFTQYAKHCALARRALDDAAEAVARALG